MDIKDLSPQRKKELDEVAEVRAQFIHKLFANPAISVYRGLNKRIKIEQIEPPAKEILRICEALPPGVAMACLMVALTDHWTRWREKFELVRY